MNFTTFCRHSDMENNVFYITLTTDFIMEYGYHLQSSQFRRPCRLLDYRKTPTICFESLPDGFQDMVVLSQAWAAYTLKNCFAWWRPLKAQLAMATPVVTLSAPGTDKNKGNGRWLITFVSPSMPSTVLNHCVVWLQMNFLPVIEFQPKFSIQKDIVVN